MSKILGDAYASLNRLKKSTNTTNRQLRGLNQRFPNDIKDFEALTSALLRADQKAAQELADEVSTDPTMAAALGTFVNNMSSLTEADIDSMTQLLYSAYETAEKIPQQLEKVKSGIASADQTLDKLDKGLEPYQEESKGTVPKLLYDEAYKEDARKSLENTAKKIKDIRENPEKYLSTKK